MALAQTTEAIMTNVPSAPIATRERRAGAEDRHERRLDLGEQEVGESLGLGEVWPRAPALTCLSLLVSPSRVGCAGRRSTSSTLSRPQRSGSGSLKRSVTVRADVRPKAGRCIGHCEQSAT